MKKTWPGEILEAITDKSMSVVATPDKARKMIAPLWKGQGGL